MHQCEAMYSIYAWDYLWQWSTLGSSKNYVMIGLWHCFIVWERSTNQVLVSYPECYWVKVRWYIWAHVSTACFCIVGSTWKVWGQRRFFRPISERDKGGEWTDNIQSTVFHLSTSSIIPSHLLKLIKGKVARNHPRWSFQPPQSHLT